MGKRKIRETWVYDAFQTYDIFYIPSVSWLNGITSVVLIVILQDARDRKHAARFRFLLCSYIHIKSGNAISRLCPWTMIWLKQIGVDIWISNDFLWKGNCICMALSHWGFNTFRPRQDGRHFPDDIFRCIFLNENKLYSIENSLKFVPKVLIKNIQAMV